MKKRLKKDIVIPAGTILVKSPRHTYRADDGGHFSCTIGLSKDTYGNFEYCIDPYDKDIIEFFEDVK